MFEASFAPAYSTLEVLQQIVSFDASTATPSVQCAHAYNATQPRVVLVFVCVKYVVVQQLLLVRVQQQQQYCSGAMYIRFVLVRFFREERSAIRVTIVHSDYYRRGFVYIFVHITRHISHASYYSTSTSNSQSNEVPCDGHDIELLIAPGLHVQIYYVLCKYFNVFYVNDKYFSLKTL